MIYLLTSLFVQAEPNIPSQYLLPKIELFQQQDVLSFHGPDGPPPDGGYTITEGGGGNFFGKVGVVCIGAGLITGALYLTAEDTETQRDYQNATIGLLGGGVGLVALERVF